MLQLREFLNRHIRRQLNRLSDAAIGEVAGALADLEEAVVDAGLREEIGRVRKLFEDTFQDVAEDFTDTTGKKALLGGVAKESLEALVDDRLQLASQYIQKYIGDVRSTVIDTVLAGKPVKVEEILDSAEGATLRNLETEINTSLMAYQRVVHLKKAEKAGIDKFLYVGPVDKVTREFCEEHVGKVFTAAEIAEMDNGQDLPVEVYGGGYNCRHHWRPVSDELAKELQQDG